MGNLVDEIEIRHLRHADQWEFEISASINADWIGEYLPEGTLYKGFTPFEYALVFKTYVANQEGYEFFGAFFENHMVGMIIACPASTDFGVQLIFWVAQDFAKNGIATKMVNEVSEIQFRKGFWNIESHTDISNVASRKVMKKCGFVIADKYQAELHGSKSTGNMIAWIKYNPYPRSPFGPRRSPFDLLKPRTFQIPY